MYAARTARSIEVLAYPLVLITIFPFEVTIDSPGASGLNKSAFECFINNSEPKGIENFL